MLVYRSVSEPEMVIPDRLPPPFRTEASGNPRFQTNQKSGQIIRTFPAEVTLNDGEK